MPAPSQREAERVAKLEAAALERAARASAALDADASPPGVVVAEGPYDPIDDLWDAKKWHPRPRLRSPVPTSPPRSGHGPESGVRNPRAPGFFRFQPVTSTLARGWEAAFGPGAGASRDPGERPRPPGSPWKALPVEWARETAPSPIERLSAALSAFAREGDGGRAIVYSEAMRLDGGATDAPLLPRRVSVGPAAVAESEARRRAAAAGPGRGGAAAVTAALAAGVQAAAPSEPSWWPWGGGDAAKKKKKRRLVASTPGRLVAALVSGGPRGASAAYADPAADRASRARATLQMGAVDPNASARSFAYDAGYEYVGYSSADRLAQAAVVASYLAAGAVALTWTYLHASQGLALGLALSWGLGTLSPAKLALLLALAGAGRAWLYPAFLALRLADRLVGWMGERLQAALRAQGLVWLLYLLLAPAHWHPLPLPWTSFAGAPV
jgi:hypothetical protein